MVLHEVYTVRLQADQRRRMLVLHDLLQEQCCGWNNYTDWYVSTFSSGDHNKVPDSCCKEEKKDCGTNTTSGNIYQAGCKDKLETLLKDKLYVVGAIGVTVVVIQILGMIFALVLICQIGKEGTFA